MIRNFLRPDPRAGSGPDPRSDPRAAPALDLLRQGRFAEAAAGFEAVLRAHARPAPWWSWRAAEARTAAGLAFFHAGDLARARAELSAALDHDPTCAAAGEYLARVHQRCGLPAEALAVLERSAGAGGGLEVPLLRAVCLGQLGQTAAAARALDRALALGLDRPLGAGAADVLDPLAEPPAAASPGADHAYPDHRCRLAARLLERRPQEAAAHLEAAIELNPRYLRAHVALGLMSLQLGRAGRSLSLLERARELEPRYPDVLAWLGLARLRSGDAHGAIRALEGAIRVRREFGRAHRFLALAHHALGHEGEALEAARCGLVRERDVPISPGRLRVPGLEAEGAGEAALQRALAIRPGCADFHLALGRRRAARGALHEARHSVHAALALQPDYTTARVELARVELALGRVAEAEALLTRVSRGQPGWVDVLALLGRTRLLMGRTNEAVLPLRAALRQRPGFAAARADLGWALQALGRSGPGRSSKPAWWEPHPEGLAPGYAG